MLENFLGTGFAENCKIRSNRFWLISDLQMLEHFLGTDFTENCEIRANRFWLILVFKCLRISLERILQRIEVMSSNSEESEVS